MEEEVRSESQRILSCQQLVGSPFSISPPGRLISSLICATAPAGAGVWVSQGAIFRGEAVFDTEGVGLSCCVPVADLVQRALSSR